MQETDFFPLEASILLNSSLRINTPTGPGKEKAEQQQNLRQKLEQMI